MQLPLSVASKLLWKQAKGASLKRLNALSCAAASGHQEHWAEYQTHRNAHCLMAPPHTERGHGPWGVTACPSKRRVELLTPATVNVTCCGNRVFEDGTKTSTRMKSHLRRVGSWSIPSEPGRFLNSYASNYLTANRCLGITLPCSYFRNRDLFVNLSIFLLAPLERSVS